ncbi:MAG: DEAD/DEAH box helicase [Methanomicrobia archaeon]|nr:DEAD/DEAH box helicase [Methanomicrobia archaeon]
MALTRNQAEDLLRIRFRLNRFYDEQWETVASLLNGQRILLIHRTGFGKSLCYQFPAIVFDGLTVVFSPLIALMRDQIQQLKSLGISAECVNSEQQKKKIVQFMSAQRKCASTSFSVGINIRCSSGNTNFSPKISSFIELITQASNLFPIRFHTTL